MLQALNHAGSRTEQGLTCLSSIFHHQDQRQKRLTKPPSPVDFTHSWGDPLWDVLLLLGSGETQEFRDRQAWKDDR